MMEKEQLLAFRIKSLNNDIKRILDRSAITKNEANLTGMQYAILGYLNSRGKQEDVFQKDVEAEFNIRRSTASSMLQLLEKKELLYRVSVPDDARLKKIILSEKAVELNKFAQENLEKLQQKLTRGISAQEMGQFFKTLQKISDNAQE
ncbi:MarR family winged helix-turn-helix transcriptional regulator [Christensenellaceae bacterium OttesenSCG-928-M15]|nr:MarR family winged helix-turn-helix transcriptional regulator [Christensenellaceae bacterium OttesenSCG-928-M15]